MGSVITL